MDNKLKCIKCGYPIKAGHLFVMVMRAADDYGTEAPIDVGGRLAMHAGECPPISADDVVGLEDL